MNTDRPRETSSRRIAASAPEEQAGQPVLGTPSRRILGSAPSDRRGFSGTCETTITDWIQVVQLGRRDAVMDVRTPDGNQGTLWCRFGDIVDATCDGFAGESAVHRILSWQAGRVAVEFRPCRRPRRIHTSTAALLAQAAYRGEVGRNEATAPRTLPGLGVAAASALSGATAGASAAGPAAGARSDGQVEVRSDVIGARPTPPAMPVQVPPPQHRRRLIALVCAGGALALSLFTALIWTLVSMPSTTGAANPAGLAVPEFTVHIDTDPAFASIVLDGKQIGIGRVNKSIARDGRTHEILISAPGFVTERLVFRDALPPQHLTLRPSAGGNHPSAGGTIAPQVSSAEVEPIQGFDSGDGSASGNRWRAVPARRRSLSLARARRPGAVASVAGDPTLDGAAASDAPATTTAAATTTTDRAAGASSLQIINDRQPRVQIIDDRGPRIDIINDHGPQIQTIE